MKTKNSKKTAQAIATVNNHLTNAFEIDCMRFDIAQNLSKKPQQKINFDYSAFNAHLEKIEKEQAEKLKKEQAEKLKKEQAEKEKPKKFVALEKKPIHNKSFFDKLYSDIQKQEYEKEKIEKSVVTVLPYIKPEQETEQKKTEKEQAKLTDKTKIYYELSKKSNVLYLVVANVKQLSTGETKNKKVICKIPVSKVENNCKPVNEFTGQIFYEMCLQLSYTALNTVYVKSCNSLILKLMRDLCRIWKQNTTTAESFEQYIIARNNCKELMKKKTHTKRLVTINIKGKKQIKKFVETIPFDTLETTKTGKAVLNEKQFQLTSDVNDIINTGVIACLELYQLGMIKSYSDIFANRKYIYKAINSYIWKQKESKESKNSSLDEIIEEHGEKADFMSISAENAFLYLKTEKDNENIENSVLIENFKNYLLENFKPTRKAQAENKEVIVDCWIKNKISGITYEQLSMQYDLFDMQIKRNIGYIDRFITDNYSDIFNKFDLVKAV